MKLTRNLREFWSGEILNLDIKSYLFPTLCQSCVLFISICGFDPFYKPFITRATCNYQVWRLFETCYRSVSFVKQSFQRGNFSENSQFWNPVYKSDILQFLRGMIDKVGDVVDKKRCGGFHLRVQELIGRWHIPNQRKILEDLTTLSKILSEKKRLKCVFFLNIFWCDLPHLAVFIISASFLPSSGTSFPSSFLGKAEIWTHVQGPWLGSWVFSVHH